MNIPGAFPLNDPPTYWQWRELGRDARGKDKWRTLRWRMTEVDAAEWAAKNGKTLEKVPGSAEVRQTGGERPSYEWSKLAPK